MTDTATSSRIHITKNPMAPAHCAVCLRSANGEINFLDFNADLDWYGAIVICEDCAREMVVLLEYAPVALVNEHEGKIEELLAQVAELQAENDRLKSAINSIVAIRPDLFSDDSDDDSVDGSESEPADSGRTSKK